MREPELQSDETDAKQSNVEQDLADLRAEVARLTAERDREKARTDIVIAEFDAPWPHSHTVADVVSQSLTWQIHQCRAAIEDRATAAESALARLRQQQRDILAKLREYQAVGGRQTLQACITALDELAALSGE